MTEHAREIDPAARRRARLGSFVAALLYLVVALWTYRALLPAFASVFPQPVRSMLTAPRWEPFRQSDQKLTAMLVTHTARTLVTEPWNLMDSGLCHPLSNGTTLGHHMIGAGVRGVVPWVLTRDPILTYNSMLIATLWIAGMAMYALAFSWTGSVGASLVAGFLFAFYHERVATPAHVHVWANQWLPLVLLFLDRVFRERRWRGVAALTLVVALRILEGAYQMVVLALVGVPYGLSLALRNLRTLTPLIPKLLVFLGTIGLLTAAVLAPYLESRTVWPSVGDRQSLLLAPSQLLPGGFSYPGTMLLLLAALGLLDRLRGPRRRNGARDPRLIVFATALLALWASLAAVPIPFVGRLPGLYVLLAPVVPGLDLVRVFYAVGSGVWVGGAALAAYGVLALIERRPVVIRGALTALLSFAVLAETLAPPLARASFGVPTDLRAYAVRPPTGLLALYDEMPDGAVIDLPLDYGKGGFYYLGQHVLLSAFHGQPSAGCYNSFLTPVQHEVEALARRLPTDPAAGEALHALGFRNVVVHLIIPGRRRPPPIITRPPPRHLVRLGQAGAFAVYRLESSMPVEAGFRPLAVGGDPDPVVRVAQRGASIELPFRNTGPAIYRHPDPIVPSPVTARWHDASGAVVQHHAVRMLLPLVLGPGEETQRPLTVPLPDRPGEYRLTLAPTATPDLVLAHARVRVEQ